MSRELPAFPDIVGQRGLATLQQLWAADWTRAQVRHRLATAWQMPYPRVVVPHRGPLDEDTLLVGAALWAGDGAALTGLVALQRYALTTPTAKVAAYLAPTSHRGRQHDDARVVRTTRMPECTRRDGPLAVAPAARALADAACLERVPHGHLEALAIAVLQRGLATPRHLDDELWQRPDEKVRPGRKGLDAFSGGAWSRPEAVLRSLSDERPDLPLLLTNCRIVHAPTGRFLGRPDGWLPRSFLGRIDELVALGPASPMPDVRVVDDRAP